MVDCRPDVATLADRYAHARPEHGVDEPVRGSVIVAIR
jgi:hypothetical protein